MKRLEKSILATMGLFAVLQMLIFASFAELCSSFEFDGLSRLLASVRAYIPSRGPPFYAVLLSMLNVFKNDFVKEPSGERLERVNLANVVTLFRVTSMPTLLFLVMAAKDYRIRLAALVPSRLVFATDFADGYISRKTGQVTKVGKMLDSASDYALLIVLTIVFYYFSLVPSLVLLAGNGAAGVAGCLRLHPHLR